ncbi:30S ribosomal protein S9 [Candidatus Parcubacteria bacterium]|nr:MAG: 30S ribosomal protein S9 [Candidatus Parcubacteria bacterium]
MTKDTKETTKKTVELPKLKGKYIATIGRRKVAIARVRVYKKGDGAIIVNGMDATEYFSEYGMKIVKQPLKLSGNLKDFTISAVVTGGGKLGQASAIRHGISRALVEMDETLKPSLRAKGWVTRDARRKERKKPGLKKARRAPQWSKR